MQPSHRVALYARVSTTDQTADNQLMELRAYCTARGWTITTEYVDTGISGSTASRPQLDTLIKDARRRRFNAVVCWKLDRLGRNLQHLITLLDEITSLGIGFISLGESIDLSTSAGRLQLHLLGAFAQFERERIRERGTLGSLEMRILAAIHPPDAIRAILECLGLPSRAPPIASAAGRSSSHPDEPV